MHCLISRGGLLTSKALTAPDGILPVVACVPVAANGFLPYYGIERVQFNTLNGYSNTSKGDNNFYIDRTCNQINYRYSKVALCDDNYGTYGNPHRVTAFIDYTNDGDFNDANETHCFLFIQTQPNKI
jgi:hypothetical protein